MMSFSEPTAAHPRARNVTVVLGPTNTGKTHLAVERMLGHETGMIGLPLRLLAREIYDKVVARCGAHTVALVTGEEKIVPSEPKYYVCTVEAMPTDVQTDFLAIDEIQLAADLERGHIFTDRLLHRRGQTETMILGAGTMRTLVEQLLPGAHFITRTRFSKLTYAGQKKITRLPPRSAVVCFSADMVYSVAELIRRQRGGAAVVMGALSPRTRNAQVELYQSGDVDFLVATDAIGMGLNMEVDHVAFASTRKFDGNMFRGLKPAEMAQIAGRAGRHMSDGTFGVTGEAEPFEPDVIEQMESHQFEPVRVLQWRNRQLDFSSLSGLAQSLSKTPGMSGLTRAMSADDMTALDFLSRDPEIREAAGSEEAVNVLWDVCQIPDYRNITGADHAALLGRVFRFLRSPSGTIPKDWFAQQVSYADRTDGDIDTLSNRIAHIRTWTFIANKSNWLDDPVEWQQRTRAVEDRLSDALHECLTQRFIDRRTSVLMKRMREKENLMASVSEEGDIAVEGEFVGHLKGFTFVPDPGTDASQGRTLRSASIKAVAAEISAKAKRFVEVPDTELTLALNGDIVWQDTKIARLHAGDNILKPRIRLTADDQLTGTDREAVQDRAERWLATTLKANLEPLQALESADDLDGLARGIAFRLVESLGVLPRDEIADDVKSLDQTVRAVLRKYGIRFGAFSIYLPALLKPAATQIKLTLWGLQHEAKDGLDMEQLPAPPQQGLTSVDTDPSAPAGYYRTVGFRKCGTRAVRIDMLERLSDLIRPLVFWKPASEGETRPQGSIEGGGFAVIPDMMSLVGCSGDVFAEILRTLGFQSERRRIKSPQAPDQTGPVDAGPEQVQPGPEPAPVVSGPTTDAPDTGTAAVEDVAPDETAASVAAPVPEWFDVWKPRKAKRPGTGPKRPLPGGRAKQKRHQSDGSGRKTNKRPGKPARPAKPAPPPPTDSPFAALSVLKAALEEKQRKGS